MSSETIQSRDGGSFDAYLAVPEKPNGRGIVVLQEIFGVTRKIRGYCDLFAQSGYYAAAPDLYWRMEPGVQLGYAEEDMRRAFDFLKRFDEDKSLDDIAACADLLRAQGAKHVATVGFCLGGKLAPLSLPRGGGEAAVSFYGVGLEKCPEALKSIRYPVQLNYGDADTHIAASAVAAVEESVKGLDNFQVLHYPTGGHGFFRPDLKNEESQVSYQRMLEFLDRAF